MLDDVITAHLCETRRFFERLDLAYLLELVLRKDLAQLMVLQICSRIIVQLTLLGQLGTLSLHNPIDNLIRDGVDAPHDLIRNLVEASGGFQRRVRVFQCLLNGLSRHEKRIKRRVRLLIDESHTAKLGFIYVSCCLHARLEHFVIGAAEGR